MPSDRSPKPIGLAIVGAGRIGLIRGEIAARHPNVGWIGVAETRSMRLIETTLAAKVHAHRSSRCS